MEPRNARVRYDEFSDQFIFVMHEHWPDILQVVHRQSPRVAMLLRTSTPVGLKRNNGMWRIHIAARRAMQPEKLTHPRDNEIVAQAIRLFYHRTAQFKLPRILVDFDQV